MRICRYQVSYVKCTVCPCCVLILTCCIIFQFESSSSPIIIRKKMNEEVPGWRNLARRQGIATIWISEHGWCIWIAIINAQKITLNMNRHIIKGWRTEIIFCYCNTKLTINHVGKMSQKYLTHSWNDILGQNLKNWIWSIVQLTVECAMYNLYHFDKIEEIQVM